ncbi:MAG: hypothetical protein ACPGO5_03050 [Patescibacteria group bacterium]
MNSAQKATILYFDQFQYPLTKTELDTWQLSPDIEVDAENIHVESDQGFYFLSGRKEIVETRKQRYLIAEKKYLRALKYAKLFRLFPSVRMVAICNSLAFSNARDESDIDFFIVTRPGSIWLTRFWLQSFLRLFRLRPHDHGVSIQDALCLSFFSDTETLDFTSLQATKPDVYLAYWLAHLVVLYDPDNTYEKIWEQNKWVRSVLPHSSPYVVTPQRRISSSMWQVLFRPLVLSIWERPLRSIQEHLLSDTIKETASSRDTRVVLDGHMLKFHTNDRRIQFNKCLVKSYNQK